MGKAAVVVLLIAGATIAIRSRSTMTLNNLGSGLSMTPSRQAKAAGLKNLTQVSNLTGVSLNTLTNWHRDKQKLFAMVIEGCVSHQAKKTA